MSDRDFDNRTDDANRDGSNRDHPNLDDDAGRQRGDDPDGSVGRKPRRDPPPEPDPTWTPDADMESYWKSVYATIAGDRQPRREDILPYLLIRGRTSGDRGQRPLWPPIPAWESPDILLIDAAWTGAFDPARLVGSPTAGRTYRVFVHVWNLGLFPAIGAHVRAWYVNPGFFNGSGAAYQPILIGGAMVDLDERTRPSSHRIVEIDQPWTIPYEAVGHDCMIANVTCPGDPWSGVLDANTDRHVAQRNLTILVGDQDAAPLLGILARMVPDNATLEIIHAGPAGQPVLQAITGGHLTRLEGAGGAFDVPIDAAPFELLRHGVAADDGQHLLIMRREPQRIVFARSDVLAAVAPLERRVTGRVVGDRPGVDQPAARRLRQDDVRRVLRQLDDVHFDEVAATTTQPASRALPDAVAGMLGVGDLRARTAAAALGGRDGQQHVLRFTASDTEDRLIGGYTVIIA